MKRDVVTEPVLLQYSTNGGIVWQTIEQFSFSEYTVAPKYIALHMPAKARTNSTRLRWWQPSTDGTYQQDWAIDQVNTQNTDIVISLDLVHVVVSCEALLGSKIINRADLKSLRNVNLIVNKVENTCPNPRCSPVERSTSSWHLCECYLVLIQSVVWQYF